MRLWCIHPSYLDSIGLVACWREGLLARKVLRGETKGYRNHPQLERFKKQADPLNTIDAYLTGVYEEAAKRGYRFSRVKIQFVRIEEKITVSDGQLDYEIRHLREKLWKRDKVRYDELAEVKVAHPHPLFRVVGGGIETWERVSSGGTEGR